jgi:hypothetical protein
MKEAFRGMVKSIIQYLIQLIAKMIVVKILQVALGAATGKVSGGGNLGSGVPDGNTFNFDIGGLGKYNGGEINRANGGQVMNGFAGRDSVRTNLAKGEWVVHKGAVDSVGKDFMADLNNRGARALKTAAPIVMPAPAKQEMKVFVVANDDKPQMGPNDVLVVIHDDIKRGGATKQLIKHVSQGG